MSLLLLYNKILFVKIENNWTEKSKNRYDELMSKMEKNYKSILPILFIFVISYLSLIYKLSIFPLHYFGNQFYQIKGCKTYFCSSLNIPILTLPSSHLLCFKYFVSSESLKFNYFNSITILHGKLLYSKISTYSMPFGASLKSRATFISKCQNL